MSAPGADWGAEGPLISTPDPHAARAVVACSRALLPMPRWAVAATDGSAREDRPAALDATEAPTTRAARAAPVPWGSRRSMVEWPAPATS